MYLQEKKNPEVDDGDDYDRDQELEEAGEYCVPVIQHLNLFDKCIFDKCIFDECVFDKCIFGKCIFDKCIFSQIFFLFVSIYLDNNI